MGWPKPSPLLLTDSSTAEGIVNNTIVPQEIELTDLRFHWLCFRKAQGQFPEYLAPGLPDWGNHSNKHNLLDYHECNLAIHARTAH